MFTTWKNTKYNKSSYHCYTNNLKSFPNFILKILFIPAKCLLESKFILPFASMYAYSNRVTVKYMFLKTDTAKVLEELLSNFKFHLQRVVWRICLPEDVRLQDSLRTCAFAFLHKTYHAVCKIQVTWKFSCKRFAGKEMCHKHRIIHKSLWDFRTRLRNNQDRHGRKEHINR